MDMKLEVIVIPVSDVDRAKAFYEELGRVGLVDEYGPKGFKQVQISGRVVREQLSKGELPDPRVMRPETARILIESMKGH